MYITLEMYHVRTTLQGVISSVSDTNLNQEFSQAKLQECYSYMQNKNYLYSNLWVKNDCSVWQHKCEQFYFLVNNKSTKS